MPAFFVVIIVLKLSFAFLINCFIFNTLNFIFYEAVI